MRVGTLEIQIMASLAKLSKDMNDAQRMVGGAMGNVEKSVASAKRAMQALGVGLPLVAITDQVRRMTDQYTKLDAQLRLSTRSQAEYARGMADIRRISAVAQADISATSMLYTRLMNVMQGTGVEQSKLATVTETVSFGLKAYGATAQEASSAALQLSQAMGANRLGGEEFRAVMEAMPNVMKVVADSMGVPLGSLRQLSIDGKITADVLVKALGDPAIAAQFKAMAMNAQTVTGAWIVARNELTLLVGEFAKSSGGVNVFIGLFNALAETFALLAKHMRSLILIASTYAAFLVTKLVVGTAMAIEKSIAHTEALAMNAAMTAAEEKARISAVTATLAANRVSIAAATAKLAEADAVGALTVAHYNDTRAAEANIALKQAERAAVVQNLAQIGKEAAATNAAIASKGAAVSNALRAEQAAIMERRALAKIELAQIDSSIAAYRVQAAVNVQAQEAMTAAMAQRIEMQTRLLALEEAQVIAEAELAAATKASAAAEANRAKSALGWIASIGVALRTAAMAHPITAAIVAITAIITAIANWKDIVDGSRASFSWFMDEFIGGLAFGAKVAGIELAAFVQKIIFVKDNFDKLFSADPNVRMEFARGMKQLTDIAESEKIRAAAVLRGIDDDTRNREALEQAMRQAQDREAWDKLTATKKEQRAAEIAELDAQYVKLAGVQGRSQAEQLRLAEQYRNGLALINEKYSRADVKAAVKADKELQAIREASIKYEQDIVDGINAETDALLKKIEQERFDTEAIGKTKEQLALLQSVRYDNVTVLLEQKLATLEAVYASEAEIAAVREQIKARKELKGVWSAQATAQAAEAQKKAWKEVWDSVDKVAHDTFVSIMDGGKNTAARLKEAFKNGFFDWLYSMTKRQWNIVVGATMGGAAGTAGATPTAGGDAGGASWLTNFGGASAGSIGTIGSKIYEMGAQDAGVWMMKNADTIGQVANVAGQAMGYANAIMALRDGQWGSAIGSAVGTYFGGPIGGAIGNTIGGMVDKMFGWGGKSPTASTGNALMVYDPTGKQTQKQTFYGGSSAATDATIAGMQQAYMQAAMSLGIQTVATRFQYGGNTGRNGQNPQFALGGGTLDQFAKGYGVGGGVGFYQAETGASDAAIKLAASRAVFTALQGSELPAYLANMFNGLTAGTMTQAEIDNTLAFAQSVKQMRDALVETRTPIEIFRQNVADGMQMLGTSAATFRTDFVAAIDAGISPEAFVRWQQLGNAMDQLSAAEAQLASSWQSLTDAIFAEVARIRGLTSTPSGSMAQFTTLTAMARAGDQNAAKLLPGVARAMLDVAALSTSNAVDLARIRGRTAASLEVTGTTLASKYGLAIPAYASGGMHAGGLRLVGENGPELEYTGPSAITNSTNTRTLLNNDEVVAELKTLRAELVSIKSSNYRMLLIEDKWDNDGMPAVRA